MSLRIANPSCYWPNLTVPYIINAKDFPDGSADRDEVLCAIRNINAAGGANLIPRINEEDCVEFKLHDESCQSPVGRQGGYQEILCTRGRFSPKSVMHEICHMLGLYHEHQRPDRDDFFDVDTNHPDYSSVNYEENHDAVVVDNYDLGSIMHYMPNALLKIRAGASIPPGVIIGGKGPHLSYGDRNALREMKMDEYLGSVYDKSSKNTILVQSNDGFVSVEKGEIKKVEVPNNRFCWESGGSREWTTAPFGTNTIVVFREKGTRNINWACYKGYKASPKWLEQLFLTISMESSEQI